MSVEEIRDALNKNNLVIGSRETIKYLKNNVIKVIMISKNCPEDVRNDLEKFTTLYKIRLENFDGTSKQFGIFLGKPFPVATASVKSENK